MVWPTAREVSLRRHNGANGSTTLRLLKSMFPVLLTAIVKVAVSPSITTWVSGVFKSDT